MNLFKLKSNQVVMAFLIFFNFSFTFIIFFQINLKFRVILSMIPVSNFLLSISCLKFATLFFSPIVMFIWKAIALIALIYHTVITRIGLILMVLIGCIQMVFICLRLMVLIVRILMVLIGVILTISINYSAMINTRNFHVSVVLQILRFSYFHYFFETTDVFFLKFYDKTILD